MQRNSSSLQSEVLFTFWWKWGSYLAPRLKNGKNSERAPTMFKNTKRRAWRNLRMVKKMPTLVSCKVGSFATLKFSSGQLFIPKIKAGLKNYYHCPI